MLFLDFGVLFSQPLGIVRIEAGVVAVWDGFDVADVMIQKQHVSEHKKGRVPKTRVKA